MKKVFALLLLVSLPLQAASKSPIAARNGMVASTSEIASRATTLTVGRS